MQKVPPVMRRSKHVLIVIQDTEGKYILGSKNVYPPGIYRFVGGGVEKEETFMRAAARELFEELRIGTQHDELHEIAEVIAHIRDAEEKTYEFNTHIFFFKLKEHRMLPSSDLADIERLTEPEMLHMIDAYRMLSSKVNHNVGFSWYDYGQLYGKIHQIGLEETKKFLKHSRDFGIKVK
jgi:8-oxo-dGTP pyrophosphatase MutT (NUDIX family)